MNRIRAWIIAGILLAQASAWAAPAVVQSTDGVTGISTLDMTALASTTTTGNYLVGCTQATGTGRTVSSVTDTQSNTYTVLGPTDQTGRFYRFYAPITTGGASNVIRVTWSGAVTATAIAMEISGVNAFDVGAVQAQAATGTGTDGASSTAATTTQNGDFIIGCMANMTNTSPAITAGTSFTIDRTYLSSGRRLALEHYTQPTAGSIAATFTLSVDSQAVTSMMSFKASGGGGATCRGALLLTGVGGC